MECDGLTMPEAFSPYNLLGISTSDKETLTLSAGDITPTKKFVIVAAQTGTTDDLDGIIVTAIQAPGDADGAEILLMADAGDTITIRHNQNAAAAKNVLTEDGASIVMTGNMVVRLVYNIDLDTNGASVVSAVHAAVHGVADHTGTVGERQVEIVIPLKKALPAATNNATLDDDYLYKKPYNVARRINKWYIRFESNLAAEAIFELRKNGTVLAGSSITIAAAARDAAIDSFTEVTLADGDSLEVFQTGGDAENVGGRATVYGDEDVVAAVS